MSCPVPVGGHSPGGATQATPAASLALKANPTYCMGLRHQGWGQVVAECCTLVLHSSLEWRQNNQMGTQVSCAKELGGL